MKLYPIIYQVSPAELEDLLLSHPSIQDCAVVGVPDPRAGELPKAFVVPKAGSNLSEEEVREFVKGKLSISTIAIAKTK